MTATETKYKILIDRLRDAKPVAGNPDLLTDEIMKGIIQQKIAPQGLLVWIRPIMTAAALLLFGLFLYQQFETNEIIHDMTLTKYEKPSLLNKTTCISDSTLILSENRNLLNQYLCYMRNNQAENEKSKQFYQKYLPKNRSIITQ